LRFQVPGVIGLAFQACVQPLTAIPFTAIVPAFQSSTPEQAAIALVISRGARLAALGMLFLLHAKMWYGHS